MGKRKRHLEEEPQSKQAKGEEAYTSQAKSNGFQDKMHVQIIAGTYEHVLHGISMITPSSSLHSTSNDHGEAARFSHSFLFEAHASSIRCLALSLPPEAKADPSQKVVLATGSSDERINLYHLAMFPSPSSAAPKGASLDNLNITHNPQNRALGSLLHHSGAVTTLTFPSRGKLLSGAADNTIAATRTRDWTVLSLLKVPYPKRIGRPSGDTAGPGDVPAGINSVAVHPSAKLMVSVSKSERCMRLWNLMTGKKAGTLNFDREMLNNFKEGRWTSGEGQKVEWHPKGDEFAVAFQKGVVIFSLECKPMVKIMPTPSSTIHQIHYIPDAASEGRDNRSILAVSTEDSRVLFFDTKSSEVSAGGIPDAKFIAELSDEVTIATSRIKDFCVLLTPFNTVLLITGSSDGKIAAWCIDSIEFNHEDTINHNDDCKNGNVSDKETASNQQDTTAAQILNGKHLQHRRIGTLIGKHEIGNRITCLTAFIMISKDDEDRLAVTDVSKADREKVI